ncbi:MAG: NAD-dependent epimerase/dehydratase family protein [Solirubrobacterales bacterium]|nr:NAD-dependent epimerase/dehydratase family protein [Solirubrobacterales bacterium]
MSSRVLVIGATGFIGGMLAARLAADGHQVRCLVGRGAPRDFARRERIAAVSSARMARDEGIEGLAVPTVVGDPSGMELFDLEPVGFEEALRGGVVGDPELVAA